MSVLEAARALMARSTEAGNVGRTLTTVEIEALRVRLKGAYPNWLADLLANVPLCGLEFGWQAYPPDDDFDGVSWMEWSDAAGVVSESLDCYPGLAILPAGYVRSTLILGNRVSYDGIKVGVTGGYELTTRITDVAQIAARIRRPFQRC